ncbi:MAG: LPS export ABC transporter periplasmic protein LptC [Candidatus Zipacnadales bacterium]
MPLKTLVAVVIVIVLGSLMGGVVLYVRSQAVQEHPAPPLAQEKPEQEDQEAILEVEQFSPQHFEGGRPAWKIKLSHLEVQKGGRTVTGGQLREGLIYNQQGKPAVRFTAERVKYDTVNHNFDVEGRVRIVSPKGAVISTNTVHWDNKTRTLTTPGRVTLRTQDNVSVVTAGLRFDTPTQTVHCPNQVRIATGRSNLIGEKLEYKLENGAFSLRNLQGVIDIEEAKQRTGHPG